MIDPMLLAILACPENKQPVQVAPPEVLRAINDKIAAGALTTVGGKKVTTPIAAGLLRQDGKRLYTVVNDIPVMLIEDSIDL